jgi:hypothetical protein
MKKLNYLQMSNAVGGKFSTACGFALGVGTVAALTTAAIAPATWGFIGSGIISFCGAAILENVPAFK